VAAKKDLIRRIEGRIFWIRGLKVMLDYDLAELYGAPAARIAEAVRRNPERFPDDFAFRLSEQEAEELRNEVSVAARRVGPRRRPWAFTEQGVAMLSGLFRGPQAVAVNMEILRTFVRMRNMMASRAGLTRRVADLEKKYDAQFGEVFETIKKLRDTTEAEPRRAIGFFHRPTNEKS
jgi:hypothetical protein